MALVGMAWTAPLEAMSCPSTAYVESPEPVTIQCPRTGYFTYPGQCRIYYRCHPIAAFSPNNATEMCACAEDEGFDDKALVCKKAGKVEACNKRPEGAMPVSLKIYFGQKSQAFLTADYPVGDTSST